MIRKQMVVFYIKGHTGSIPSWRKWVFKITKGKENGLISKDKYKDAKTCKMVLGRLIKIWCSCQLSCPSSSFSRLQPVWSFQRALCKSGDFSHQFTKLQCVPHVYGRIPSFHRLISKSFIWALSTISSYLPMWTVIQSCWVI